MVEASFNQGHYVQHETRSGGGNGCLNSKVASILILALVLLAWVLQVVVLAATGSCVSWDYGNGWARWSFSCGVFNCDGGADTSDMNTGGRVTAAQAFGIMSILLISALLIIHILQAIGKGSMLAAIDKYIKYAHIVELVFAWICAFCILLVVLDLTHGSITYGFFMQIFVGGIFIATFVFCGMAGGSGPIALV